MTNYNIARLPSRFRNEIHINKATNCWLWDGTLTTKGYGSYYLRWDPIQQHSKFIGAHRFAWIFFNGPIPPELEIDHLCRVRNCVNPKHLELVTPFENSRRGNSWKHKAKLTHCKHGHPLSGSNVYWYLRNDNWRRGCRACRREAIWRYQWHKK